MLLAQVQLLTFACVQRRSRASIPHHRGQFAVGLHLRRLCSWASAQSTGQMLSSPELSPSWCGGATELQRSLVRSDHRKACSCRQQRRRQSQQQQGRLQRRGRWRACAAARQPWAERAAPREVRCQSTQRRRGSQERSRRGKKGRRRETSWRDAEDVDALLLSPLMEEQHWEEWQRQQQQQPARDENVPRGAKPRGALGVDYGTLAQSSGTKGLSFARTRRPPSLLG